MTRGRLCASASGTSLTIPNTVACEFHNSHGQPTLRHVLGREPLCGNRQNVRPRKGGRIDGGMSWNVLGLAAARRAEHEQVVRAGGGDHERAFGRLLAAHVGVVVIVM